MARRRWAKSRRYANVMALSGVAGLSRFVGIQRVAQIASGGDPNGTADRTTNDKSGDKRNLCSEEAELNSKRYVHGWIRPSR
jgi:hypothetical protein